MKLRVDSIKINTCYIPYVKTDDKDKSIVTKINNAIKDRFMIESFKPKNEDFSWSDVEFSSEIKENVLLISFSGEYNASYPSMVSDELYFDLKNGNTLDIKKLPFNALFSLNGYYDFLNTYWLTNCNKEIIEANKCTKGEVKPYCDCYDIMYETKQKEIFLYLTRDCLPHVAQGCTPTHERNIPIELLSPFLSNFGKFLINDSDFYKMTRVGAYLFIKKNQKLISDNYFIVGLIATKYKFSMAIEVPLQNDKKVTGYYFYNNKNIKIPLTGKLENNTIELTENVDGQITGKFELIIHKNYQAGGIEFGNKYMTGKWINTQSKKVANISFIDLKTVEK